MKYAKKENSKKVILNEKFVLPIHHL